MSCYVDNGRHCTAEKISLPIAIGIVMTTAKNSKAAPFGEQLLSSFNSNLYKNYLVITGWLSVIDLLRYY
jgi:hypothetical protein